MLPYAAASLLLTVLWSLVQSRTCRAPIAVSFAEKADLSGRTGQLAAYLVLFALALLTVARVVPYGVTLAVTAAALLVIDRSIFAAGVAVSQVISNVPAALLLSGFTDDFAALLTGVNLGGLGTLIASMASLISYKLIAREEGGIKGAYFRCFTAANICFLAVLLVFALICG